MLLRDSSVMLREGLASCKSEGRDQQEPKTEITGPEHMAVERSRCYPDIFNRYNKSCGDDWM